MVGVAQAPTFLNHQFSSVQRRRSVHQRQVNATAFDGAILPDGCFRAGNLSAVVFVTLFVLRCVKCPTLRRSAPEIAFLDHRTDAAFGSGGDGLGAAGWPLR